MNGLIDKLQRKLNLTRVSRGFADDAETGSLKCVRGKPHGHDIEDVEELRAKLYADEFGSALSLAEGRVLNEGKVIVVERRPTKGVSAQRAKATFVRAGPGGKIDRDGKVRGVVRAHSEVVFPNLSRGREVGLSDLIGTIGAVGTSACLLDPGVDGKW